MADFRVKTEDINELTPIGDKLIVAVLPKEKISKGGIIIPDTANIPAMLGHVLAAGVGITTESGALIPMPVKRGDLVAFTRYAGTEVNAANGSYLIMRQDDVIAVLKPNKRMSDDNKDVMIAELEDCLIDAATFAAVGKVPPKDIRDRWADIIKTSPIKVL